MRVLFHLILVAWLPIVVACAPAPSGEIVLTFPGSAVGAEATILDRQLHRFMELNPDISVERRVTPDAADQRRQLYVQWLNAGASDPDILQLDVVWTPEFAAAGWILPLERFEPEKSAFFRSTLEANTHDGVLYAMPWFVDVGMLYYRTDLVDRAPETMAELVADATKAKLSGVPYGFVWQGKRYEGLVTVFLEHLGAFGGHLLDNDGRVAVDSNAAVRALEFMRNSIARWGVVPEAVLSWQEEQTRFAFQSGNAVFMRNWPYAFSLLDDADASAVAGRFGVAVMPRAPGGSSTATLGGQQLAVNANTEHPEAAWRLVDFLTQPEQMLERARLAGQLPARMALYETPALADAIALPQRTVKTIIEQSRARPPIPLYSEISAVLQVHLHRALSGQTTSANALQRAAAEIRRRLARDSEARKSEQFTPWPLFAVLGLAALVLAVRYLIARSRTADAKVANPAEERFAWLLLTPTLTVIALIALFPLGWTVWESLHQHDLRAPWTGRPFIGLDNYREALDSSRFWGAVGRTVLFTTTSVALELGCGLAIALLLHRATRRGRLLETALLLPWAMPTVVAALLWRFLFDGRTAVVNLLLTRAGAEPIDWLSRALPAWIPVILADVWKTTPFVALLMIAGLQTIDPALYEAARIDGASAYRAFARLTLPLLKPVILVALVFRTLDAVRVFDLVYVLTGGGPGTATEPIALLTFDALLQNLRFGYGSALGVLVFTIALVLALTYATFLAREPQR